MRVVAEQDQWGVGLAGLRKELVAQLLDKLDAPLGACLAQQLAGFFPRGNQLPQDFTSQAIELALTPLRQLPELSCAG